MNAPADSQTVHRFADIQTAPPDAILGLTEAFLADDNPDKLNLTVGVYKDAAGRTPILRCVKEAERKLVESESTKGYLSIDGLSSFNDRIADLVFANAVDRDRLAIVQTPGGTGGLRIAAAFLVSQLSPIRIWMPNPTWANHNAVFASEDLPTESYRYLTDDKRSFHCQGMLEDLQQKTNPGDAVLLHACCHNPTGVDPTSAEWDQIAKLLGEKHLLPVIDFAYQGFGQGLEEDARGVHAVLRHCPEVIVCNSFSKNFGLYGERVGGMSLLAADAASAKAAHSQLKRIIRSNYSNPPRHGAAIVDTILADDGLTKTWHDELAEMRTRIHDLRRTFVETMKTTGAGHDFSFLLDQNGMFSFSGLNAMQVDRLRNEHSIYIVGSGRINVAGMSENRMDMLCEAVASVIESS